MTGLVSDRDWVAANAVGAIASRPPARTQGGAAAAAARGGKMQDMNYTQRPGFGKVRWSQSPGSPCLG